MCGRLVITEPDLSVFVAPFGVQQVDVLEWAPRFNLAPTELAPLITNEPARRLTLARFGLVPSWADDRKAGGKWINARVETVATAKPFRRALALRRGVIPVSGYYEWRVTPHGKRAVYIHDPQRPTADPRRRVGVLARAGERRCGGGVVRDLDAHCDRRPRRHPRSHAVPARAG